MQGGIRKKEGRRGPGAERVTYSGHAVGLVYLDLSKVTLFKIILHTATLRRLRNDFSRSMFSQSH